MEEIKISTEWKVWGNSNKFIGKKFKFHNYSSNEIKFGEQ